MRSLWIAIVAGCAAREQGVALAPDESRPVDTDCAASWWADADADGHGDASAPMDACAAPEGHVGNHDDCDDADPSRHPGAPELPDGWDYDCDGRAQLPASVEFVSDGHSEVDLDWQQAVAASAPAVRAFGLYASDVPVEVSIEVFQPTIVVLASVGDVPWVVTEKYPGSVQEIFLFVEDGVSTAQGPEGVPVQILEYPTAPTYDNLADADRWRLGEEVLAWTGLEVTSYYGASGLSDPYIGVRGLATPPYEPSWPACDAYTPAPFLDPEPDTRAVASACPAQTSESGWCLTTSANEVRAIGLDSFTSCATEAELDDGSGTSIAVVGGDLYACGAEGMLERVPLDGSEAVDHAFVWCDGVVAHGGELITHHVYLDMTSARIVEDDRPWASWEDAQCGPAPEPLDFGWWHNSTWTVHDGVGYAARHADTTVSAYDVAGGSGLLRTIPLEGYDGWIHGVGVAGSALVVLEGEHVRVHDLASGALLRRGEIDGYHGAEGLVCFAR